MRHPFIPLLDCSLCTMPKHGSKQSSIKSFLQKISPKRKKIRLSKENEENNETTTKTTKSKSVTLDLTTSQQHIYAYLAQEYDFQKKTKKTTKPQRKLQNQRVLHSI